jgi:hypothetical protein
VVNARTGSGERPTKVAGRETRYDEEAHDQHQRYRVRISLEHGRDPFRKPRA